MTAASSHQSRSYVERESLLKGPFGSRVDNPARSASYVLR